MIGVGKNKNEEKNSVPTKQFISALYAGKQLNSVLSAKQYIPLTSLAWEL